MKFIKKLILFCFCVIFFMGCEEYLVEENHELIGKKIKFDYHMAYVENLKEENLLPIVKDINRELTAVSKTQIYTDNLFNDEIKKFEFIKKNMKFEVMKVVVVKANIGSSESIVVLRDENGIESTISLLAIEDNEIWNHSEYFTNLDFHNEKLFESMNKKEKMNVLINLDKNDFTGRPIVFSQDQEKKKKEIKTIQNEFLEKIPECYLMENVSLSEDSLSLRAKINGNTLIYLIASDEDLKIDVIMEYQKASSLN
ncbi:MAG: hypothetical protein KC589_00850 [Nanoarchaeota archaeon]|nr:hypothetical protein [Nanoarchaeota archaeon]